MLPIASASGYAVIGGAVAFAGLFAWYLLRMEARVARSEESEAETQAPPPDANGLPGA
ncbi:MAG TPA: hypothetical protein VL979_15350 [Solirubrobacteraceae bacterium]|nr:hypothetical protein [Solirubrobacteraceae bacterium]